MEINLNYLCYPISINSLISIVFLLFFIIKKDTRSGYLYYLLGLTTTLCLSQAMTYSALLIQVSTISLFLNFCLIIFFQDINFVKRSIIPLICLFLISIFSTLIFNNGIITTLAGGLFSCIVFGLIWTIKLKVNKGEEVEIYSWEIFLLFLSIGLFLGVNNLALLLCIIFVIFVMSFIIFYTQGSDHNISIVKYILISILIWFILVHYLPSINIERLFNNI